MPSRLFRSVLWSRLDARAGDLAVVKLELHRHLPEISRLGLHSHSHWQALVYLSGHGIQQIARKSHPVSSGALFLIPPGVRHSFRREARQPPLCLMLDFRAPWPRRTAARIMTAVETARIRSLLADLARVADDERTPDRIQRAAAALALLAAVTEASQWHPRPVRHSASTVLHQVQKAFEKNPLASPKTIAAELRYHPDYLSRLVRAETGLSLRGLAGQVRLQRAQRFLKEMKLVREASDAAGFPDQNYFARWFKKQTGQSPVAWRASAS